VKICWIILWSWLFCCSCARTLSAATNSAFTIDTWDNERGLPSDTVITITQTRDGYLWLGTLYGLARFDGVRFTTFNEGNTPGLGSSRIIRLFEDREGRLWIGTDVGGIYVAKDGKVQSVELGQGPRLGRLASICEDFRGALWFYTAKGELCRYYAGRGDVWNAGSDFPSRCRALVPEGDLLWVGSDVSLVALGPMPAGQVAGLPVANELPVSRLDFALPSKQGGFWRLANGRIQKWKSGQLQTGCDWAYPWDPSKIPVNTACEDADGNLVVGTGGKGLFWFDSQGRATQLSHENSGLSYDTVLSLCLDREGDLWVGTDSGGLDRVKRPVFKVVELQAATRLAVQTVCPDQQGGLWIGYFGDQIDHWQDGKVESFSQTQGLSNLGVKSVFLDRQQNIWAGTYLGGMLELQNGRFVRAPGAERVTRDPDVSALYEDKEGRLWAGTQVGLASLNGQKWEPVSHNLAGNPVRALAQDRFGSLWIGTQGGGLEQFHQGKSSSVFSKANGLPSDNVVCLYSDPENVLWVGTSSGLARFKDGQWTVYGAHMAGAGGSIAYILEDEQGFLWLGSNTGLLRVRKAELNDFATHATTSISVRSFGKADGLPTRECSQGSQPAACQTAGKLWFPTTKGLVALDPQKLRINSTPPPILIEAVSVDGRLQATSQIRAPAPPALTVPAGAESLEIQYASLNLSAPDKGIFKYQMEGYETAWTERPGTMRTARYPRLPHGHYRFRVKAYNEDGIADETGASLAITVLPPFWQTWWFLTVTTVCLLGMVVGSVHYVSTQKLQRQLAAMRQQEALEKERARIARDLHDQLGANLTQVALLGEMAESDKELPEEVEAHARQISQTARETTRALDEIVWTVNPSNDTLDGLINYLCKYAQEFLELAGLRYRLEIPPGLPSTPISPEVRHNVFLAAKESINNVVKHSGASAAWLKLQLNSDRFTLEIEDNGRGLKPEDTAKGRNGLRNMRKRIEDVGGFLEIGAGAKGGTRVRLTAPLSSGQSNDHVGDKS
jgi:signal transduction histidine kinase/ligand-binding sensor domain-containing protein